MRNKYANYTKGQIQDKEGQLKRDYKMLKAARMQSGASWNDERNMVEGPPAMWDNLKVVIWLKGLTISLLLSHHKWKNPFGKFMMWKLRHMTWTTLRFLRYQMRMMIQQLRGKQVRLQLLK